MNSTEATAANYPLFGLQLKGSVFDDKSTTVIIVLATICVLVISTRLLSSRRHESQSVSQNGARPIPAVPYWLPIIGHIPQMATQAEAFTKRLRDKYTQGAFALNFFGTQHNIVFSPSLATALLNQKPENASAEATGDSMLQNIFGMPKTDMPKYYESREEIMACYKHLLTEPSLGDMVAKTVSKLKETAPNFVTFASSLVDEMPWERSGNAKLAKNQAGEEVVEVSFLPLVRDFCAHNAIPIMIGSDFLNNFPDILDSLWTLDRGFLYLATGLPRWLPIPALTRAHIAKKKLLDAVTAFHRALDKHADGEDPGVEWRNLDDVGSLVRARLEVYRKFNWSFAARASTEHSLIWAGNANSNVLVFWMLNRIFADLELLAKVREEIEPYVKGVQPKTELPIPESPRLEVFDVNELCSSCPLLKSCYIECLRLDTASWSPKIVKENFVLQAREKDAQKWQLRKGEYAHAAHDLHNTNPKHFEDPLVWRAERHIRYEGGAENVLVAEMGSIRPYGGGSSMCKGRSFAFRECMAFAASIIALWDIEPAGGGDWKMPTHRKATGVYGTNDDVRVWVKRRRL